MTLIVKYLKYKLIQCNLIQLFKLQEQNFSIQLMHGQLYQQSLKNLLKLSSQSIQRECLIFGD